MLSGSPGRPACSSAPCSGALGARLIGFSKELRTVIVDDEDLARELLTRLVVSRPELKLVGVARDGEEAVALLDSVECDVVFLDIEMPGLSGFGVLERLAKSPYVVFTTSHADFALDAFEVGAVDFLVKPIAKDRFQKSVERVLGFFKKEATAVAPQRRHGLFISEKENNYYVRFANIVYVSSHENYCAIHAAERDYVTYCSLKAMEERLPQGDFVRIYKQYIVNVNLIDRVQSDQNGSYTIYLKDEDATQLPVGRAYLPRLKEIMA